MTPQPQGLATGLVDIARHCPWVFTREAVQATQTAFSISGDQQLGWIVDKELFWYVREAAVEPTDTGRSDPDLS